MVFYRYNERVESWGGVNSQPTNGTGGLTHRHNRHQHNHNSEYVPSAIVDVLASQWNLEWGKKHVLKVIKHKKLHHGYAHNSDDHKIAKHHDHS